MTTLQRAFPGDTLVWKVAAVAGLLTALVLGSYLLEPRDYRLGGNGARPNAVVAGLERGGRACTPGLVVPEAAARVEVILGGAVARPRVRVVVRDTRDRRVVGAAIQPASAAVNFEPLSTPVELSGGRGPDRVVPVELCVTSLGAGLTVGGTVDPGLGDNPLYVNGQRTENRMAVWYQPERGAQRSIAGQFPEIARRAALFRPGWVGAWTLWAIALVLLPAIGYLSVRAVASARDRGARPLRIVVAVALIAGATWGVITEPFDTPDEPEHFAYVQHVATTGHAVDQTPGTRGVYSTQQTLALRGVDHTSTISGTDARRPWLRERERRYEAAVRRDGGTTDNGGGFAESTRVHSPVYYALVAPAYGLASSGGPFWTLWALRLTSALLLAVMAAAAYGTVRELLPRQRALAVAAGLLVGLHPMVSFMGGAVNNDMGVNAAGAVLIYLLIRGLRRGPTPALLALIGAVAALAPFLKATALSLYPAVAVAIVGMLVRSGRGRAAVASLGALVTGAVAAIAAGRLTEALISRHDDAGATASGAPANAGSIALERPLDYLSYLWQTFLPRLPMMADRWTNTWPFYSVYVVRGFGAFGWYAYQFTRPVFVGIVAVCAVLIALGVVAVWRWRSALAGLRWELAVLVLAVAGVFGGVAAAYYTDAPRGPIPAEQGRYAFTAAAAFATLAVGSLMALPARWRAPAATALVIGMFGLTVLGRSVYLAGVYT